MTLLGGSGGSKRTAAWSRAWRVTVALLYPAAALLVVLQWLGLDARLRVRHRAVNSYWAAHVPDMIEGTAWRPFVLRTLLPTTVRLVHEALPDHVANRLRNRLRRNEAVTAAFMYLGWEEEFVLQYLIASCLVYAAAIGFLFSLRSLSDRLCAYAEPLRSVVPLGAVLLLPALFFQRGTHFLYDIPTLFLFTLGLSAMRPGRWSLFYAVLLLGNVNRETTLLLTLVFAVAYRRRLARAPYLLHVAAQCLLWTAVRLTLLHVFRDNPGPAFQFRLHSNLASLGLDGGVLLLAAGLVTLVVLRFPREHWFLRASLACTPPLVLAYVVVGVPGEVRVFYEAYPVLVLWTVNAVVSVFPRSTPPATAGAEAAALTRQR